MSPKGRYLRVAKVRRRQRVIGELERRSHHERQRIVLGPMEPVSVVIPVYNGAATIIEQLDAVAAQAYPGPVEIVVADNGSVDDTAKVVARWAASRREVMVIDASHRRGPSHARNRGVEAASAAVVLFCDADDRVRPGWAAAMVRALADAEVVAARVVESPDAAVESPPATGHDYPFLPWAAGALLGVRRDLFLEVGGFDEDLRIGEDVELCWRIQVAGGRFRFAPDAEVWMRERDTMSALFVRQFRFGLAARDLYRGFESAGARWPGWRRTLRTLVGLARDAPLAALSTRRRRIWVSRVGGQLGRMLGALRSGARGQAAPESPS